MISRHPVFREGSWSLAQGHGMDWIQRFLKSSGATGGGWLEM